jgi:putative tricarboxylic transport membrane protein
VTRPLSAYLIQIALLLLIVALLPNIRRRRDEVFTESEN